MVVAVVDDGIDFSHPDLADRAWTNPGESGGGRATNGIDDDANGYVDDVHGWDFCNNDNTVHDPGEDWHGTHVSGTIAASLDGAGTLGVAPGIRLMALKFIDDGQECGTDGMAVDAIDYAASFGVGIINASWGGPEPSAVLDVAIAASGALFVAAAGNDQQNMDGKNSDGTPGIRFYPAASTLPNVVSVAAIDQQGRTRLVQQLRQDLGRSRRARYEHPEHLPGRARLLALLRLVRRHVDGGAPRHRGRGARREPPAGALGPAGRHAQPAARDGSGPDGGSRQDRHRSHGQCPPGDRQRRPDPRATRSLQREPRARW